MESEGEDADPTRSYTFEQKNRVVYAYFSAFRPSPRFSRPTSLWRLTTARTVTETELRLVSPVCQPVQPVDSVTDVTDVVKPRSLGRPREVKYSERFSNLSLFLPRIRQRTAELCQTAQVV